MMNGDATAPPYIPHSNSNKDALFVMANETLYGTNEWITLSYLIFAASTYYVSTTVYHLEANTEMKLLAMVLLVLTCYSSVNIQSSTRNRRMAALLEQHGMYTPMGSEGNLASLRGSTIRYALDWLIFAVSVGTMVYAWMHVDVPEDKRAYLAACAVLIVNATFTVTKCQRDQVDSLRFAEDFKKMP